MRAAIYARFSSDKQRDESIEDQIRLCSEYAKARGHHVGQTYSDAAMSGASLVQRPDILRLLSDARGNGFEVLIVEAMDRLSRNQRDIADIYQNMVFSGIPILSVSEGKINELHIGLKGTMNALFLKDLAIKTRRGQRGRVEAGRIPGGLSYGYDMVPGEERGKRTINEAEAAIVRQIFTEYASGVSPRSIAKMLNEAEVPSPRGGQWQASTINGNRKRGNGILPNRLYAGEIVYNRQSFLKDPRTGKRVSRMNPTEEWVIRPAPELRIIGQELWEAVQSRKNQYTAHNVSAGQARRSRYLVSGILKCEECGGPYTMNGIKHMRCSHRYERGTCSNKTPVKVEDAEERILNALEKYMRDPEYLEEFIREYQTEWAELDRERLSSSEADRARLAKCEDAISALVSAIEGGVISKAITDQLSERELEAVSLRELLSQDTVRAPISSPQNLAQRWNDVLKDIRGNLGKGNTIAAAEILKRTVKNVTVSPREMGYDLMIKTALTNNDGCGGRI